MCNNECVSNGICKHNEECYADVCFSSEQLKVVDKWLEDKRNKTINEVRERLNKCQKDINNANRPFNFIDMVLDEMQGEQKC